MSHLGQSGIQELHPSGERNPGHPSSVIHGHILKEAEALSVAGTIPVEPSVNMNKPASTISNLMVFIL